MHFCPNEKKMLMINIDRLLKKIPLESPLGFTCSLVLVTMYCYENLALFRLAAYSGAMNKSKYKEFCGIKVVSPGRSGGFIRATPVSSEVRRVAWMDAPTCPD